MSNSNDPFSAFGAAPPEQTFVMPTPGIRPAAAAPSGFAAAQPMGREAASDIPYKPTGLNPLLAAANPLLNLVTQLRQTTQVADVDALRESLVAAVKQFESNVRTAGIANERVIAARYILCTVLDETAASTPWGGSGAWARHSLLVSFHNESWGGEKVFQLLGKLAQAPRDNLDLLELIYACIVLGFQGRYRVVQNGLADLQTLRERLSLMIKEQRGRYDASLALNWAPTQGVKKRFLGAMPLWVASAVVGLILLAGYMVFTLLLTRASDPLYSSIIGIRAKGHQLPPPVQIPQPRLRQFLEPEIKEGLVDVKDYADRSIVTIRGDGLFERGSATLEPAREPLIARIADALSKVQGTVLVTGHTDNTPIGTARFPSNWHLSHERAKTVAGLLGRTVLQGRIQPEGRADSEPVASNDTAAGKAQNRRVEITLLLVKQ